MKRFKSRRNRRSGRRSSNRRPKVIFMPRGGSMLT